MIDYLIKGFLCKNDTDPTSIRKKCGTFSSIVGILANILLTFIKLIGGLLAGSIAIIADALNNLSDAGSSVVTFFSFRISSKPANREHPFGYARMEYICSMIVSFLILVVGFELFTESITSLYQGKETLNISLLTIIILSISIVIKLLLGLFNLQIAKKIDSTVIKATATDSFTDAISTTAVLISSIIIYYTDWYFIDGIIGICVSMIILLAGIKILNETKNSLLGEAPVDDVLNSIHKVVSKHPTVLGVHDMMVHNYGPHHFIASFHAEVDGSSDVFILHDEIDIIEKEINDTLGILCTIHLDPIVTDNEEVNKLREFTLKKVKRVYPDADIHDFRTVVGNTHTNLIFDLVIPFENNEKTDVIKRNIEAEIQSECPHCYCVITIDRA